MPAKLNVKFFSVIFKIIARVCLDRNNQDMKRKKLNLNNKNLDQII